MDIDAVNYSVFLSVNIFTDESCMALWFMHGSLLHTVLQQSDFFKTDISRGRVTMHLSCGVIFNIHFTANLPMNLSVKDFW